MKWTVLLFAFLSCGAFAQDLHLPDFNDFTVPDIARRGLSKETVFNGLNRRFVKLGSSICSNRALIWAYDMKRQYRLDTAKIFLFYSELTGEVGDKTWWYHVAPMVNENGTLWVVDAGFPRMVRQPLLPGQWLKKFAGTETCRELTSADAGMVANVFNARRFPSRSSLGVHKCYYVVASGPYWTPTTVAQQLLGADRYGTPGDFSRANISTGELMQACIEATTTPLQRALPGARSRCRDYFGF